MQDCALVSLHGRALERIVPHLQPRARVLALSWDGETPARLAALLCARGLGEFAPDRAGGDGRPARAPPLARPPGSSTRSDVDPLNTVALEVADVVGARVAAARAGPAGRLVRARRPDHQARDAGADDLGAGARGRGELLWDVGAGSGSIAIEWLLADPSLRAIAVERDAERAARIRRNAAALGVPHLDVVEGAAPEALAGLPAPDAVFIGGGARRRRVGGRAGRRCGRGGRLVVNAVTLGDAGRAVGPVARATAASLLQMQFARAEPVGRFRGFRPAMPVVQWRAVKP